MERAHKGETEGKWEMVFENMLNGWVLRNILNKASGYNWMEIGRQDGIN